MLEKRKKEILNLVLESEYNDTCMIYQLVSSGNLDNIICKITDELVYDNMSFYNKDFFTANEQFLNLLSNLISYFNDEFAIIGNYRKKILSFLFENQNPEFLLCKKYWGNNDHLNYFKIEIKKFIIYGFQKNIQKMYYPFKEEFNRADIYYNMDLNDINEVNKIYKLLIDMSWCTYKEFGLPYLFYDFDIYSNPNLEGKVSPVPNFALLQHYKLHWKYLLSVYDKKKNLIAELKSA